MNPGSVLHAIQIRKDSLKGGQIRRGRGSRMARGDPILAGRRSVPHEGSYPTCLMYWKAGRHSAGRLCLGRCHPQAAAQAADRTSTCFRAVSVVSSCLSGGYLYIYRIVFTITRSRAHRFANGSPTGSRITGQPGKAGVSIPTRHCCRVMLTVHVDERIHRMVSIHTRHCCRVMQYGSQAHAIVAKFQSTPGIAAG